jgi:hypothetical protein
VAPAVEIDSSTGEEKEEWCAEMGDPAGEKEGVVGCRQRFRLKAVRSEEVAGVVESHDDHYQAAKDVD